MNCITIWRRITGPIGGKWIPYPPAVVAARRAAQMVATVVCFTLPPAPGMPPKPVCDCPPVPAYAGPPLELVPAPVAFVPQPVPVDVPAPPAWALLAVALVGIWRVRYAG